MNLSKTPPTRSPWSLSLNSSYPPHSQLPRSSSPSLLSPPRLLQRQSIPLYSASPPRLYDATRLSSYEQSSLSNLWDSSQCHNTWNTSQLPQTENNAAVVLSSNEYRLDERVPSFESSATGSTQPVRGSANAPPGSPIVMDYYYCGPPTVFGGNTETDHITGEWIYESAYRFNVDLLVIEPTLATSDTQQQISHDAVVQRYQHNRPAAVRETYTTLKTPPVPPANPRTSASTKANIECEVPGCPRRFGRITDRIRHLKSVHAGEEANLWCPAPTCSRGRGYGGLPFKKARKDKLCDHIRKVHNSDADKLLRPRWFRQVETAAST
ncbi:hypothetical protein CC86DRAFT_406024 [Ophiobolus disseminans]|uniref:C2H2-type domain-containing protein n=1 Tax=Ophiobolus disseminans TaxID=1469910 RepID=A0A6A7A0B5_9PLEO|nr:hypothetical protein CC86DRAFT_406024 [Ophiobolus disseminans]